MDETERPPPIRLPLMVWDLSIQVRYEVRTWSIEPWSNTLVCHEFKRLLSSRRPDLRSTHGRSLLWISELPPSLLHQNISRYTDWATETMGEAEEWNRTSRGRLEFRFSAGTSWSELSAAASPRALIRAEGRALGLPCLVVFGLGSAVCLNFLSTCKTFPFLSSFLFFVADYNLVYFLFLHLCR